MTRMLFTSLGIVIGEVTHSDGENLWTLKNPRIVMIEQQGNMIGSFKIGKILGDPKTFSVGKGIVSYDVNDKAILDKYSEDVTGIKVVSQAPHLVKG